MVKHIDGQVAKFDETISRAQREIELIQEYRTRLIADIVTGRADVRHLAVTEGVGAAEEMDRDESDEDEADLELADVDATAD
ncbi:hypothetical protein [uncultured Hymenobacter sp.]|uniref:hypothetical protein n=1 Tax=uncultured Hymenobacter sp. TaxID=170016 RepID=UPI0035C97A7E